MGFGVLTAGERAGHAGEIGGHGFGAGIDQLLLAEPTGQPERAVDVDEYRARPSSASQVHGSIQSPSGMFASGASGLLRAWS